eukprot:TRINITY_DN9797_c0_g1_i1.p1 TRINITY_DN9797_c0_g1~~TRINITY_DN9797_c0_g1_i1.p1  ORF type:complete len:280 (-),score=56.60 TRINITY_DN9797_c0_g1_i1:134-973(-)
MGREECSQLFKLLKDGNKELSQQLLYSVSEADQSYFETLISITDNDMRTALHWACHYGFDLLLPALISISHNWINSRTIQGFTPLYIAARKNYPECVQILLDSGADPNLQDGHHQTSLHRACENSLDEVAQLLASSPDTDINIQDLMGRSALHWACSKNLVAVALLLVDRNAKFLKTKGGETPLHWACRGDSIDIVNLILEHYNSDINVYSKNERGESALTLSSNNPAFTAVLLEHADRNGHKGEEEKHIQNINQTSNVTRLDTGKPKKLNVTFKRRRK